MNFNQLNISGKPFVNIVDTNSVLVGKTIRKLSKYGELTGDGPYASVPLTLNVSALSSYNIANVFAGYYSTFIVTSDYKLFATGYNGFSNLAVGSSLVGRLIKNFVFVTSTSSRIVSMGFSRYHTVAVTESGEYFVWGWNTMNTFGLVAPPTVTVSSVNANTVVSNPSGKKIVAASSGWRSSSLLASDGTVYTIGANDNGALGANDTNTLTRLSPSSPLSLPFSVNRVHSGYARTIVLGDSTNTNNIVGWGQNEVYGALGSGQSLTNEFVPVSLATGAINGVSINHVSLGGLFTIVLDTNGNVYGAGYGYQNMLGNAVFTDTTVYSSYIPINVGNKTIKAISSGLRHTVALATDNTLWAWGNGDYGQTGTGSYTTGIVPTQITTPTTDNIASITTGHYHTCYLTAGGVLYCWGRNDFCQIGGTLNVNKNSPGSPVSNGATFYNNYNRAQPSMVSVAKIAAGGSRTGFITESNRAYMFGMHMGLLLGDRISNSIRHSCLPVEIFGMNYTSTTNVAPSPLTRISPGYVNTLITMDYQNCYGIPSHDVNVCGGRGLCVGLDTCVCYSNDTYSDNNNQSIDLKIYGNIASSDYPLVSTDTKIYNEVSSTIGGKWASVDGISYNFTLATTTSVMFNVKILRRSSTCFPSTRNLTMTYRLELDGVDIGTCNTGSFTHVNLHRTIYFSAIANVSAGNHSAVLTVFLPNDQVPSGCYEMITKLSLTSPNVIRDREIVVQQFNPSRTAYARIYTPLIIGANYNCTSVDPSTCYSVNFNASSTTWSALPGGDLTTNYTVTDAGGSLYITADLTRINCDVDTNINFRIAVDNVTVAEANSLECFHEYAMLSWVGVAKNLAVGNHVISVQYRTQPGKTIIIKADTDAGSDRRLSVVYFPGGANVNQLIQQSNSNITESVTPAVVPTRYVPTIDTQRTQNLPTEASYNFTLQQQSDVYAFVYLTQVATNYPSDVSSANNFVIYRLTLDSVPVSAVPSMKPDYGTGRYVSTVTLTGHLQNLTAGLHTLRVQISHFGANTRFIESYPPSPASNQDQSLPKQQRQFTVIIYPRSTNTTGYFGPTCGQMSCYGQLENSNSVCNNKNGTCVGYNSCVCNANYTGSQCEIPICYGIQANKASVCSGNGTCVAANKCVCTSNYAGSQCQYPICSGKSSNDASVCSGHGVCSAPSSCICDAGYYGNNCQFPSCGGIVSTNATVCSGRGICTGLNTCNCSAGYTGNNCEYILCGGVSSQLSIVCSSH
ncbi:E3 ubiquitin-protein ligase HERC, partial [Acrasis kona]